MRKSEAFRDLGYDYKSTRGVWSAEKTDGVLMTIWQREIGWLPDHPQDKLYVDLDEIHPEGSPKRDELAVNPRLRTRARRIKTAQADPNIAFDVVVLLGPVGNDKGLAFPWHPHQHGMRSWRPVSVDDTTNFFGIETTLEKAH